MTSNTTDLQNYNIQTIFYLKKIKNITRLPILIMLASANNNLSRYQFEKRGLKNSLVKTSHLGKTNTASVFFQIF